MIIKHLSSSTRNIVTKTKKAPPSDTIKSTSGRNRFHFPSISFSGAGFLGCYHAGAAACLLKHGLLLRPMERRSNDDDSSPLLLGVSAGALISAALSAGVQPEDAMNAVYEIANRTRERGGVMDVLKPGFSLIDQVEDIFIAELQKALGGSAETPGDYDNELLLQRTNNGKLLRIGLTDKRKISLANAVARDQLHSYVYANQYRDLYDVIAASILSSYIPLATGPLLGSSDPFNNGAVKRAWKRVKEMEKLGFLKHELTGLPVKITKEKKDSSFNLEDENAPRDDKDDALYYWDGGLANMWPCLDDSTLIITPVNGAFKFNPSIAPSMTSDIKESNNVQISEPSEDLFAESKLTNLGPFELLRTNIINSMSFPNFPTTIEINRQVSVGLNLKNVDSLRRMARSSEISVLEERYKDGYDDASQFLKSNSLLSVFTG